MIAFLDPTALAALYIEGPEHQAVRAAVDGEETVAIATISQVHFVAMLDALLQDGVEQERVIMVGGWFNEDLPAFVKVRTEDALNHSLLLAHQYHLTADQAVQLSAALLLENQLLHNAPFLHQPVRFISLDKLLLQAAEWAGLRIS